MLSYLRKIYYDSKHVAGYGGVQKLYKEAKKKYPNIQKDKVIDWLRTQDAYNLHRPVRKTFPRNRVYVSYKDQQFEIDLVDIGFGKQNWAIYLWCLATDKTFIISHDSISYIHLAMINQNSFFFCF